MTLPFWPPLVQSGHMAATRSRPDGETSNARDAAPRLSRPRARPHPRPAPAIWTIGLILCAIEALLTAADLGAFGPGPWRMLAYSYGAFWDGLLADWTPNYPGQPALMFLTYAWLHGDVWHLAGNLLTLAYLAPVVAARAGTVRMLTIYALAILGGAAAFALLSDSAAPMVGASGALFGLAGGWQRHEYALLRRAGRPAWPVGRAVLALAALNVVMWWALDGLLAWEAHLGGFVAGWVAAWALESGGGLRGAPAPLLRRRRPRGRTGPRPGSLLTVALVAGLAALAPVPASTQNLSPFVAAEDGTLALPVARRGKPPAPVFMPGADVRPVLGPAPDQDAAPTRRRRADARGYALLRELAEAGQAAGNAGDLYENRDGGHSLPALERFPQITRVKHLDEEGRDKGSSRDPEIYGLAAPLPWHAPTVGNASAAFTSGPFARSLPRAALTLEGTRGGGTALAAAAAGYEANRLYVYPEHRDHDEGGDLIPANLPYWIITQGSSGSDRTTVEALMAILAAFPPETKARLAQEGLIAPTLQAIFRQGYGPVRASPADPGPYLTGLAHPSVFDGEKIDLERMVAAAAAMGPDAIPPAVRLEVVEEDAPDPSAEPVAATLGEALHDGPRAIARVWRRAAPRFSMTVRASAEPDFEGRETRFEWRLLRGDPNLVRIEPLGPEGREARIEIGWQGPRPAPGGGPLSPRVDIGVFALDGVSLGMPGLISVLLPAHERRDYSGALDSLDAPLPEPRSILRSPAGADADPLIWLRVPWRELWFPDGTRAYALATEDGADPGEDAPRLLLTPDGWLAETPAGAIVPPVPLAYRILHGKDGRPVLALGPAPN